MGKKAGNRKHSKIDALDPALRETVEQMLLSGSTYSEIVEKTGVSTATIGRVNRCLNYGAGGYQLIFEKLSEEEK